MRPDLKMMLRGVGKFLAVALAAGLGGAAIGIGLAELTGDDAQTPTTTAATTAQAATTPGETQTATTETTETTPTSTATATTPGQTNTTPPVGSRLVPRVEILSAQLGAPSSTGEARVTVRVRVTNRYGRVLEVASPVLVSEEDRVKLDESARKSAAALPRSLDPGESATGELRFTAPAAIAQRLGETPSAQLRIAARTVVLKLQTGA